MPEISQITKCILTDQTILSAVAGQHFSYSVIYGGKKFYFTFCTKCFHKIGSDLNDKKHIVQGFLLNKKIPEIESKVIHWDETHSDGIDLKKEIEEGIYPRTPKEQFDNLFYTLYHKYILGHIEQSKLKEDSILASSTYFRSAGEMSLFFDAMKKQELFDKVINDNGKFYGHYQITYQGLDYYIKIFDEGYTSTKCFVAMSFQDKTIEIREAIRSAITQTGFEPIFIDERNISSEKTINDEIISNLKKCKFCVADFTYHKNGVYFESGFAVGQGKPVIYTCEEEEFKTAHFDIKPLQHIIYKTTGELRQRLIHKIEAWIK